ncbi:MAG: hypothetical protein NTZ35_04730, partial [Ignavibacteriales bacterium]|nr:hypothetical protein [Ignavibacteriales bacterium]
MITTRRFASVLILLISVASFVFGQSIYRTLSTGTWETTATWEKSTNGTTWSAATTAPTSADSVIIQSGHVVTLTSSGKTCKSLNVQTGGQIRADFVQPTSSIRYIRVYGGVVQIDGVFGRTDSSDVLSLEAYGSFIIQGSGTANVCRIRPGSSQSNLTITISMDMTLTYVGGSGTGGSGLYTSNSSNDNITVTIADGKTLTTADYCNVTTSSSSATDGTTNTVLNINGHLVMQGGNFSMIVGAGKTCTVNVAGTLTTGKGVTLTGTSGVTSTINVSGTMNVGSVRPGTIDFTNTSQMVTGAGTFNVGPYATLNVGAAGGLNATTGPIRTTTATFDPKATYAFAGQAAQSTGALLPTNIARLTVNNTAGVTLTQSTAIDTALTLTAGTVSTGANTLTVGSNGTVSRTAGYVVGNLEKIGVAALQKFDVGTATGYAPVEVTPVSGSGDVAVMAVDGAHPNKPAGLSSLAMYWTLAGGGITNANITFSYPASLAGPNESNYAASFYEGSGTSWTLNPTTVNTTAHSATVNGVSIFSDWTLVVNPYDDPAKVVVKNAGAITVDGKLDEGDWTGAPTLLYGLGAAGKKQAGELTVTGGVDVKNPFTDNSVSYSVPHKDSSLARVKFLRNGLNLYIGIQSDDKSICKFGWEGDGLFMKIKTSAGQVKEYKLYWQNFEGNKDTMRYEPGVASSGAGWGYLPSGSTVNDTANVD